MRFDKVASRGVHYGMQPLPAEPGSLRAALARQRQTLQISTYFSVDVGEIVRLEDVPEEHMCVRAHLRTEKEKGSDLLLTVAQAVASLVENPDRQQALTDALTEIAMSQFRTQARRCIAETGFTLGYREASHHGAGTRSLPEGLETLTRTADIEKIKNTPCNRIGEECIYGDFPSATEVEL